MLLTFQGPHLEFLNDKTPEIQLAGALSSGKTTVALWKDLDYIRDYPGIHIFLCRYSDSDCKTKLKPAFEELCAMREEFPKWNSTELAYEFGNGSKVYCFGIRSVDALSRYAKLRGLGVSRITVDQAEELPSDIALEIRARLRQRNFPHQLTFVPNPPNVDHWLAKQFPVDNSIKGRRLYEISLYDNSHNLPPETVQTLERAYPPEHAKHCTVVMGKRGVNVTGEPVYGEAFVRKLHVRPIAFDINAPLLEAIDFGKKHPCWVVAQQPYAGGLSFLGGILGQEMFLEDFLGIVKQYREQWFPNMPKNGVRTCCTMSTPLQSVRFTGMSILREMGFDPIWNEHGNSPDVVLAVIERLAGYMRRRSASREESLGVNINEMSWLRASREGIEPCPFVSQAFEAGYVWDTHMISVGSNEFQRPKSDAWFEHGMRCAEAIELNFGADRITQQERERRYGKPDRPPRHVDVPTGWMV